MSVSRVRIAPRVLLLLFLSIAITVSAGALIAAGNKARKPVTAEIGMFVVSSPDLPPVSAPPLIIQLPPSEAPPAP